MKALKTLSMLLAVLLTAAVTAAPKQAPDPHAEWYLRGDSDRNPLTGYRAGDTITFTLKADLAGQTAPANWTMEWVRSGGDGKVETGSAPANKPVIVKTSLDRPGFVDTGAAFKTQIAHTAPDTFSDAFAFLVFEEGAESDKSGTVERRFDDDGFVCGS